MPHIDLLNSQMQVNGTQAISVQGPQPHHTPEILKPGLDLQATNQLLSNANAKNVVEWSANTFGDRLVMSTSFGIQAAVMLHLVTQIVPHIPVIWVDTGYLPAETYRFAEELSKQLNLNLRIYQSPLTPGRMEALYGKLWDKKDLESLNLYDHIRKVEPMQRALLELNATAWLAGLRRTQTSHRESLERVEQQGNHYKVHPILHWDSRDVYQYLTVHNLPYHPYFEKGYVSVGDWHSSRPMIAGDKSERDGRFHGLKQECGLHLPLTPEAAQSLDSSTL
ncbi:phosphoadenosine phosphosulfate reductase [cyanobacterium endosymbiont of Rhopalodia gibberula]|uniref:phosphoadenosine phosphosulfate reductase n=1 Tax=cyanobacterium endosymbiont of Rhopalodia gibberula TaxID=1763363 RepID=UPI000DC6D8E2|nr:phosphoadenosine phosphosulfate reductase [cyanobacterium endosymbiont of Rhopalodia gibberula]BBA79068.1 phosphoadenosine phosphosulfate reductase [cyanobacterium endosymbiont of Rhopalodia gibberula]